MLTSLTALAAVMVSASSVFAADVIPANDSYIKVIFAVGAMIATGIAIGCGTIGAGIGNAASGACETVGRNPGIQGKVMMTMLVGTAMTESIAIHALVVSLVLLSANPAMGYFPG